MQTLSFTPLYKERVWGGRCLETIYSRPLPTGAPYGESWEISDRPDDQSIVAQKSVKPGTPPCAFTGKSLHELWTHHREEIFGVGFGNEDRFPILIKLLDARSDLSIQVHPPKHIAEKLGGDPKTEMWYIADAQPDATLYLGVKAGVTKETMRQAIADGSVADQVHAIQPQTGESVFIESGRLHAIGCGFLIYEIQQNSDTTYRVFDWNRIGLSGKPRDLHVEPSLACIDFSDIEPTMDTPEDKTLAKCPYFKVDKLELSDQETFTNPTTERFSIITVIEGNLSDAEGKHYTKGDFFLIPVGSNLITVKDHAKILQITIP